MEPIDYKRAITRRWPLILVCAIVAAVVAVLIPVHESATASQTTYQAQALTGIPPSRTSNANALSAEVSQIEFYAEQQPVYVATAKAAKIKGGIVKLRNEITLKSIKSKKKKIPPGSFYVQVTQLTKAGAASLANTFVKQLTIYADQQLAARACGRDQADRGSDQFVEQSTLLSRCADSGSDEGLQQAEDAYSSYDDDHETEDIPTSTTTSSTTTSTTAASTSRVPNVAGDQISAACSAIAAQGLACSPVSQYAYRSSSTVPENDVITTNPGPGATLASGSLVKLVISEGPGPPAPPTSTVPTTASTTAVTTAVQSGVATLLVQTEKSDSSTTASSTGGSTSTTTSSGSKDQLGPLQAKQKAVQSELSAALQHLAQLQNAGTPTSGLTLLAPARANQAKAIPGTSSPFAHRSIRGLIGLAGGVVIGLALALLLDALDKRLRKSERVSQVFDLPVIAEVPKSPRHLVSGQALRRLPERRRRTRSRLHDPYQRRRSSP